MKPRLLLMLTVLLCGLGGSRAQAKPEYLDVLINTYKPYAAKLQDRSCANCHVSNSDFARNPYGKQMTIEMEATGNKELTPDILHKIENLDSDNDGATNIEEIKAGTAPGDPHSGGTGKAVSGPQPASSQTQPPSKPWFPKYAFHPAIVHFPIGLFIAGLLLDFIGLVGKRRTLLFAGWYNLVLAAISAVAALGTGYIALVLLHMPFTGLIRQHIILAAIASVLMWVMVALRVHRHEKMSWPLRAVYYILAAAGLLLISYAGHIGDVLVYGE